MGAEDLRIHSGDRLRSVLLAVAATSITGAMWVFGWLPPMERATGDFLLRTSTSERNTDHPIVVVLIDDRAVDQYGPLPWPRDQLARLVDGLSASGATGVAIDSEVREGVVRIPRS